MLFVNYGKNNLSKRKSSISSKKKMKKKIIILTALLFSAGISAQETLTLEQCREMACRRYNFCKKNHWQHPGRICRRHSAERIYNNDCRSKRHSHRHSERFWFKPCLPYLWRDHGKNRFSSACICARCTKKQDLPRRQTLFFRKFPSQLRYSHSRSRTIRT